MSWNIYRKGGLNLQPTFSDTKLGKLLIKLWYVTYLVLFILLVFGVWGV